MSAACTLYEGIEKGDVLIHLHLLCAGLLGKASHRSCRDSLVDGLATVRPSPEVVGSSLELPTVGRMAEAVTRMAQKPSSNPNPPSQVRSPSPARSSAGALDTKIGSIVEFVLKLQLERLRTVGTAAAASAARLALHARDVCARHVCVSGRGGHVARGTCLEVAFGRPWSVWDHCWTCMAAVAMREGVVQVAGCGGAIGRSALLRSTNLCIRVVCRKSPETRVV